MREKPKKIKKKIIPSVDYYYRRLKRCMERAVVLGVHTPGTPIG